MKFMLFGGETYYALGGGHDLLKASDDLQELTDYALDLGRKYEIDWFHILNVETGMLIIASGTQAHGVDEEDTANCLILTT